MTFPTKTTFTFNHSTQQDVITPGVYTPTQLKTNLDSRSQEMLDFVNAIKAILEAITAGASGSHNIGSAPITGVTGTNVYAQLANLKTLLDAAVTGQIPDGTLGEVKLATALANKIPQYGADAGTTDDYVITLSPAPTAYFTGMVVRFKANTPNTGAATLNPNGLGAKTIKKNFNADLDTGDILANQIVEVVYDGTNFQLISVTSQSYLPVSNGTITGTTTINNNIRVQGKETTGTPKIMLYMDTTNSVSLGSTSNNLVFASNATMLLYDGSVILKIVFGAGSPEGIITANPGSLYLNTSGGAGTTLYVKQSGAGNVGWIGK